MRPPDVKLLIGSRWPGTSPVAATEQLRDAGLDDRILTHGVKLGSILRLRRGAYIRAVDWTGAKPWEQDKLRVQAHFLTTNAASTYSHVSAARLHDCWVWQGGREVHVSVPFGTSRSNHGRDVVPHHLALDASDVVLLTARSGSPIKTTSLARTVLDCARTLELPNAVIIGDHALRKGLTVEGLRSVLDSDAVKRGSARARRVLDALDARSESAGESRTRLLLRGFDVPQPEPQLAIPTDAGTFRADFAWKERKLILEFDGRYKYFDFKSTEEMLFEERRREKKLMELGWTFIRIEWPDLARPYELQARVVAALGRSPMPGVA
ncbi:MAG: endonuclease domain-containing protein [Actinomycetota bacterium]|nr:endonuclease domain-containing protein [Actinomycetota bacterium]